MLIDHRQQRSNGRRPNGPATIAGVPGLQQLVC
jgi:hypothetical protein